MQGRVDVLAQERAAFAERFYVTVDVDRVVRHLAASFAAVAEQHADAAVDVELRVTQRGAGARRQRVEVVAVLAQVRGEGLEHGGPLVERQLA